MPAPPLAVNRGEDQGCVRSLPDYSVAKLKSARISMRFAPTLLSLGIAMVITVASVAATAAATKPADKAAPTKPVANELTVDLKVKGMT